jgi:hypothetical protein
MCEPNEFELIRTMEDIDVLRPYDVCNVLEGFAASPSGERIKSAITPRWKYYKLKMFFADSSTASITLTFKQIEDIIGSKLPSSAKDSSWWYPRFQSNRIAEAWVTEGYTMQRIDTEKEKVTFHRNEDGMERLVIPQALLDGKLPANAVFELETHMEYIINKYGLGKERKKKSE